ncbi:PEP-CTERM sorting domain-containing protein [Aphanothece sacrum]|uniref:PEP-CTERM sorting domain-containing protein n=1 Tax=Aphanothece sacrum TaxID=1122 RepID=UPI003F6557E2
MLFSSSGKAFRVSCPHASSFTVEKPDDGGVVPEPLTMLGAGAAVAFGGAFKRKLGQAKKNDKNA